MAAKGPRIDSLGPDRDCAPEAKFNTAASSPPAQVKVKDSRRSSRRIETTEYITIATANIDVTHTGKALNHNDQDARIPSSPVATASRREGRQSTRQIGNALDECIEFPVGRSFAAHEPLPELIVFAVEQP